jgi:outer membrane phospholipase A
MGLADHIHPLNDFTPIARRGWGFRSGRAVRVGRGLIAFLAFSGAAFAEGLVLNLVAPPGSVAPGTEVSVGLLAVNSTEASVPFDPPLVISAQLWQGDRSWPVQLTAVPGKAAPVLPGGFTSRAYTFALPPGVSGRLILEANDGMPNAIRAVFAVTPGGAGSFVAGSGSAPARGAQPPVARDVPAPLSAAASVVPAAAVAPTPAADTTAVASLQRGFLDHFSSNEPIYFIYGPKSPAAKFQFSFKYRFFSFDGGGGADQPERSLQFGYTQRSLWAIDQSSSPFYDTSYMPALFYEFLAPARRPEESGGATWLGFQSGFQHESNGQGGTLSRTLNTLYLRTGVLLGRAEGWHTVVQIRGFDYVGGISENPYLKDYRGYAVWGVTLARGDGPSLSYSGWMGQKFNHVTSEYDLNIPVKTHFLDFATYFLIQWYDGYGESLRAYDRHADQVRAGISLAR